MGTIIRCLCHRSHSEKREPAEKKKKKKTDKDSVELDPKTSRKGEATQGLNMTGYFINSLEHSERYTQLVHQGEAGDEDEHWFNAFT